MTDDNDRTRFSRRKLLGGLGAVGAAGALGGAATNALLWDEEVFGSMESPNVLQAGQLDLQVGWEVNYFDGRDSTPDLLTSSGLTDNPGPLVDLADVKPGDVVEHTLSFHVFDNPGFVSMGGAITADEENGTTEPEAVAEGDGDGGEASDIELDNGTYEVHVGERDSGSSGDLGSGNGDWIFTFDDETTVDTLYEEFYFLYGNGNVARSDDSSDTSVASSYPSSGTPGTQYAADIDFTLGGIPVSVTRTVELDATEPIVRLDYEFTNEGDDTISDFGFGQYVDYDVGTASGERANYTKDESEGTEYIWQFQEGAGGPGNDLYVGFTGGTFSADHHLDTYPNSISIAEGDGPWNDDDEHPDAPGTTDVDVAMKWGLGDLAPGESTTLSTAFVTATNLEDFEEGIGENDPSGPGESEPPGETEGGDLDDHMQVVVWYDGDDDEDGDSTDPGNNFPEEITDYTPDQQDQFLTDLRSGDVTFDTGSDEFVFQGSLRAFLDTLESDGLLLDPRDDVPEEYAGSYCFRPSTTHYLGVLAWLPRDIPGVDDNVVQTDRVEYHFGFDAVQCRHNVDSDGLPIDGSTGGVDTGDDTGDDEPTPVTSTFETDDEGWLIQGDAESGTPDYMATDGNPGGHICADDSVAGGTWYFAAPSDYHGDRSDYYDGSLSFDLKQSSTSSQFNNDDVVLSDGSTTIVYDFGGSSEHPGTDWTPYDVPLSETDSGWTYDGTSDPVSQSDFQAVLGGLSRLEIRGEYRSGSDTGCLDSVELSPP